MEESPALPIEDLFQGYLSVSEPSERQWFIASWPGVITHDMQIKEALALAEKMPESSDRWWFTYHLCHSVRSIPEEMAQYLLTEGLKTEDPGRLKECLAPVLKRLGFYKTQAILLQLFPKLPDVEKNRAITCFYWGRPSDLSEGGKHAGYFNWWEEKEITRSEEVKKIEESLAGIQQIVFSRLLEEAETSQSDSMKMKIFQLLPRERDFYQPKDWDRYAKIFGK